MDSIQSNSDLLFGVDSNIISSSPALRPSTIEIIDTPFFDFSTLLLFVMYIYLLYYFKGYMLSSISSIFNSSTEEKLVEESGFLFNRYLSVSSTLGLLTLALFGVKFIYELLPLNVTITSLPFHISLILLASFVVIGCVQIFQITFIKIVCFLIESPTLNHYLIRYNRLNHTIIALIFLPIFLLISQFPFSESPILLLFALTILFFLIIIHIYRSLKFFIRGNISILYSILYLCIVELFPISFIVLLIDRYL